MRWGAALLVERLPHVWDLNFVRVDSAPRRHAAERLADAAERVLTPSGLAHRRITVADERLGESLAPGLAALGWTVERLTVMALRGARAPDPGTRAEAGPAAEEVTRETVDPLLGTFLRAMPHVRDEETVRQLLDEGELTDRVAATRRFAAPAGGPYAAACRLHLDGGLAEIDDVGTLEDRRRQGLGGAVLEAAIAAAHSCGRDLVFLRADEHDWPRAWYERLGFVAVGGRWAFTRPPCRRA